MYITCGLPVNQSKYDCISIRVVVEFVEAAQSCRCADSNRVGEEYLCTSINPSLQTELE